MSKVLKYLSLKNRALHFNPLLDHLWKIYKRAVVRTKLFVLGFLTLFHIFNSKRLPKGHSFKVKHYKICNLTFTIEYF